MNKTMRTIKELEQLDRKIMGNKPSIWVGLMFLLFGICTMACFFAVVWVVSYGVISLGKLVF